MDLYHQLADIFEIGTIDIDKANRRTLLKYAVRTKFQKRRDEAELDELLKETKRLEDLLEKRLVDESALHVEQYGASCERTAKQSDQSAFMDVSVDDVEMLATQGTQGGHEQEQIDENPFQGSTRLLGPVPWYAQGSVDPESIRVTPAMIGGKRNVVATLAQCPGLLKDVDRKTTVDEERVRRHHQHVQCSSPDAGAVAFAIADTHCGSRSRGSSGLR